MEIVEIVFWIIAGLIAYTLIGYPIALTIFSPFGSKDRFGPRQSEPTVSFIVAAYNEEGNIAAKVKNLLEVEYPGEKIEFIIGSDASTDATDRILAELAEKDSQISHFRLPQREGKVAVLNRAVSMAEGEILVFTDCSVRTDPDIMDNIIPAFENEKIGLVSSRDIWVDPADGTPLEQKEYIGYEMKIRRLESRLNSLVSASGSFFAVRKELFGGYGTGQADDFALPLQVYSRGYRVVHNDDLIGYVPMVKSSGAELARRTRIIQAGIKTVIAHKHLLNPFRHPVFAWQLWSHKMLKWLFPFMLFVAALCAILLFNHSLIYMIICILGATVLIMGFLGGLVRGQSILFKPFRLSYFFLLSMLAVLKAWGRVIAGGSGATWEPSHR